MNLLLGCEPEQRKLLRMTHQIKELGGIYEPVAQESHEPGNSGRAGRAHAVREHQCHDGQRRADQDRRCPYL